MLKRDQLHISQLILPIIVLVGLLLRLYAALNSSMGFDESWHVFISRLPFGPLLYKELAFNTHPPLFFVLLKGVLNLYHNSLSERLISLLASVVALVYLSKIIHKLEYPQWVAWVATLCMAFASNHISISIEVRGYSLALACILGFTYYFIDYLSLSPPVKTRDRILFQLFLVGAIYTHYYSFVAVTLIVAIPFLHLLWNGDYRKRLFENIFQWRVLVDGLVSCAIVGGMAVYVVSLDNLYSGKHVRLSHLKSFFLLDGQSVRQFLSHNLLQELKIFTPLRGWYEEQLILLLALQLGVLLWLFIHHSTTNRDPVHCLKKLFPHYLLIGLLIGLATLALNVRYPFGGAMRHQSVLLPFVYLWTSVILYHLLELVRNITFKEKLTDVVVGLMLVLCLWNYGKTFRVPTTAEDRFPIEIGMASEEIENSVIWLSGFNFIALYSQYRNWEMDFVSSMGSRKEIDIYRVQKGSETNYLIRDLRWHHPPIVNKEFLYRVRNIIHRLGIKELSVFQIAMENRQRISAPEEYQEQLSTVAPRVGLQLTAFRHKGKGVWATFQLLEP